MCGNKFRADCLKGQYSVESAEVEQEPEQIESAKTEPVQTESAKIEPKTEERTDFQKYVDDDLNRDPVLIDSKFKKFKERLEAYKPGKFSEWMEKADDKLEITKTLKNLAKKYCGDKGEAQMIVDKFKTGLYLPLKEGKDFKDLADELLYFKKKLDKAVTSDEEDEKVSNNQAFKEFCELYLWKYYDWLMKF